jgi:hypothetical protein
MKWMKINICFNTHCVGYSKRKRAFLKISTRFLREKPVEWLLQLTTAIGVVISSESIKSVT